MDERTKESVMRHIINVVGILAIAVLFYMLMSLAEVYVLNEQVIPRGDITIEEWLDDFKYWAAIGIVAALATSLLWYVIGQWFFRVDHWATSQRRPVWALLFIVPAAVAIVGMVLTKQPQEGWLYAPLFFFLNGILVYYLQTTFFSPSSFKYTPVGASKLRRWNITF